MLTPHFAILQALRQGPGYGQLLVRRVSAATGARRVLSPGSLYPALQGLRELGLIRSWSVVPGRERGGRSRRYVELTAAGIREAERQAAALTALVAGRPAPPRPSPAEASVVRARLARVDQLFEFAHETRASLPSRRRRP